VTGRVRIVHARASVTLLIHHARHMRHIVTSFVASLAPPYFSTYLINGTIFEKKILNIKCVCFDFFFLQLSSKTFSIRKRICPKCVNVFM
jgi:hypothetical protein